jgi:hypothetical protein
MKDNQRLAASFRDPSGFLFQENQTLYRQVNQMYQPHYDRLIGSGLYAKLTKAKKLIPHDEVELHADSEPEVYRILKPELVEMISYPYEWCFSQLKDAALLTLDIQREALECGLTLKDASAYNIQFQYGHPVLIDSLSFEVYQEGNPWVGYRQFCQHFLAPLALMAYCDIRLRSLLIVYVDGVPLDLAAKLMPARSMLKFGLLTHLHLHAALQKKSAGSTRSAATNKVSKLGMIGLIDSLRGAVNGLRWKPKGTDWGDYYEATNYSDAAFEQKALIVKELLEIAKPSRVSDLGANTGVFSRLAADAGIFTLSSDYDPAAVEKNYRRVRQQKETHLLPLIIDLTNPSSSIGWQNLERDSFLKRSRADLVMALALIHHLVISNNVPLPALADFFAQLGRWLIVEFIPKSDSQVQRLLASREDIFHNYTKGGFEQAFAQRFRCRRSIPIEGSERVLYLFEQRDA